MRFRVLGPLDVTDGGREIGLAGGKQRALLCALLLDANRVVSVDRLIDALWDGEPPETAVKAVQVHISQLRKAIGDRVQRRGAGYLVTVGEDELDLLEFDELVRAGDYHSALRLWRGQPLADFGGTRFAAGEAARLEELRLGCLERRIDADLAGGSGAELVGELEALIRAHPLRERLRAQLMLALYRAGRQADALEAFQAARTTLVDELGIEPSRELRDLHQRILNQDAALDLLPPRGDGAEPARGVFVGRQAELGQLLAGLDDAFAGRGRLFLLVGEPGIGKSRLMEELVAAARARGARVLVGRCWEAGGAPAYWPWVQSLRTYVRETDAESLRRHLGAGVSDL